MQFNLNSFLLATSTALDHAEEEIMNITTHHSKRCAYISLRIGLELNLSEEECFDLCSLALMHDNGITQAFHNQGFLKVGSDRNLRVLEKLEDHCKIGEENIKNFPFLTSPKNVVLYHHEYLDGSGLYEIKADEIPFFAQIICFADNIDMKFDLLDSSIDSVSAINEFAKENKGKLYLDEIVDAFVNLSGKISFWRDLHDESILASVEKYMPTIIAEIELKDLLEISYVFSNIIDAKSNSTAAHSTQLVSKAKDITKYLNWDEEKSIYFQVAANLHDIGKLSTPRVILEKNDTLSKNEFEEIKKHAYITHMILKSIDGFEMIHKWASTHHERNDGSGYPFGLKENELCFESKLLSCLDMYQALREERPYREALTYTEAIDTLHEDVSKNLLDKKVVDLIAEIFADEKSNISDSVILPS